MEYMIGLSPCEWVMGIKPEIRAAWIGAFALAPTFLLALYSLMASSRKERKRLERVTRSSASSIMNRLQEFMEFCSQMAHSGLFTKAVESKQFPHIGEYQENEGWSNLEPSITRRAMAIRGKLVAFRENLMVADGVPNPLEFQKAVEEIGKDCVILHDDIIASYPCGSKADNAARYLVDKHYRKRFLG